MRCFGCQTEIGEGEEAYYVMHGMIDDENCFVKKVNGICIIICKECISKVRVVRSEKEIRDKISEIEEDERLKYPCATVFENAPLALHQLAQESKLSTLKWVLGDGTSLL